MRGKGRLDTHRSNVTMEAETGVMWPEDKECQQPTEAGRGKEWLFS